MLKKISTFLRGSKNREPVIEILLDASLDGYSHLIDLFPEAAHPNAKAQDLLERLHEGRKDYMGGEINPDKHKVVPIISLYKKDNEHKLRVWAAWKDNEGNLMPDQTSVWHEFTVTKDRARELKSDFEVRYQSTPETRY